LDFKTSLSKFASLISMVGFISSYLSILLIVCVAQKA